MEEEIQDSPIGNLSKIPLSIKWKGRKLGLKNVTSKLIYEELLAGIQTTPSAQNYFKNKFKSNELDWPRIYQLPRSTCVTQKLEFSRTKSSITFFI